MVIAWFTPMVVCWFTSRIGSEYADFLGLQMHNMETGNGFEQEDSVSSFPSFFAKKCPRKDLKRTFCTGRNHSSPRPKGQG